MRSLPFGEPLEHEVEQKNHPGLCTLRQVTDKVKMLSSSVVCSVFFYNQLVDTVSFKTTNIFHEVRRFNTCRPYHDLSRDFVAIFQLLGHQHACVTIVLVRTFTPSLVSSECAAEIWGGRAGRIRSPASTRFTFSLLESRVTKNRMYEALHSVVAQPTAQHQ